MVTEFITDRLNIFATDGNMAHGCGTPHRETAVAGRDKNDGLLVCISKVFWTTALIPESVKHGPSFGDTRDIEFRALEPHCNHSL
jgi:hypothetical protein